MTVSQCIKRHLSNNILKKNDLSYYQGRTKNEKWPRLLAQICSSLSTWFSPSEIFWCFKWPPLQINSQWMPLQITAHKKMQQPERSRNVPGNMPLLCSQVNLVERTPEKPALSTNVVKHTITLWTDTTSIQNMHVSRSSEDADSTAGKISFTLKFMTDWLILYYIQPMNFAT